MIAQPAWQLPMTHGLPSASGCKRNDLLEKDRLGARDVLDRLARHGIRQKADEIAGMPGLERDADFAVGLEAANARTVSGARIDNDERPALRIDLDALRRNDPHEGIVDRPLERAAVDDELHLVIQHMRGGFGQMFAILIAALAHDVPEQDGALRGVDHVFHGRRKQRRTWMHQGDNCSALQAHCCLIHGFDLRMAQLKPSSASCRCRPACRRENR